MKIKLTNGLPSVVVTALGLRDGRQAFEEALDLDSRVVPVVIIADVGSSSSNSSNADTKAGYAMTGRILRAGTAAEVQTAQLFNPIGSGVEAFVWASSFMPLTPATNSVTYAKTSVQLGTATNEFSTNNDLLAGAAPKCVLRTGSQAFPPPGTSFTWGYTSAVAGAEVRDFQTPPRPWRLAPGSGINISSDSINVGVFAGFHWLEFPF